MAGRPRKTTEPAQSGARADRLRAVSGLAFRITQGFWERAALAAMTAAMAIPEVSCAEAAGMGAEVADELTFEWAKRFAHEYESPVGPT